MGLLGIGRETGEGIGEKKRMGSLKLISVYKYIYVYRNETVKPTNLYN